MNFFFYNTWKFHEIHFRGHHSRDRIAVGFTTTCAIGAYHH